jgi:DNA-binding response OmpR family regulator
MPDSPRRILVVDDSLDLCGFLEMVLRSEGYQVESANSLDAARERLEDSLPNVVIGDVRLPGSPPFAVLDLLKTRDETRDIPVLLCSGAVNEIQAQAERLRRERVLVLAKPFEIDALIASLSTLLQRSDSLPRETTARDTVAL